MKVTSFVLATALATAALSSQAQSLTIVNPGFESLAVSNGAFVADIPGWSRTGDSGTFNPGASAFPGGNAFEGQNVAYSSGGGPWISQTLTAVLLPDTVYRLGVFVGRRLDEPFPGYVVELRAGGQFLAADNGSLQPAAGSFLESVVTFTSGSSGGAIGQALEIRFRSLGRQVNFDSVSLVATPVPETSSTLMLGAGVISLLLFRRRAMSNPRLKLTH